MAEIPARGDRIGIATKFIHQEPGRENNDPHRRETVACVTKDVSGTFRLLLEPGHPRGRVDLDHPEMTDGRADRQPDGGDGGHPAMSAW